jgi:tetratricopeptide (TPR) repeat protein
MLELSKWDLDVETNDGEEYTSLVRAVRRTHQRFKLLFVSCSPSQGEKIRRDLMLDVPAKTYELLDIKESIENLYEAVSNIPNLSELDVLFIRGLEYSIFEYEDREFGDISKRSQSKVYGGSWAGVPPVLAKLNMQRELFRDRFSHICFVFLLPHFAIDYFIRRAPDFYDWKSGIYRFETDAEDLRSQVINFFDSADRKKYFELNNEEKLAKIREIRSYLDEVNHLGLKWELLSQLSLLYIASDRYLPDSGIVDRVFQLKPDCYEDWYNSGLILHRLGRHQEAIDSYNRALKLQPNQEEVWYNRGNILYELSRYEKAIDSYDLALKLQPDRDKAWYNRGNILYKLGRYEEAVDSYNRVLKLQPDRDKAWYNHGNILYELGRYEEAVDSYDRALKLQSDQGKARCNHCVLSHELGIHEQTIAWYNRGITLNKLGRHEEAIASYNRALELQPNREEAWYNRGNTLNKLGKYEEAIASYNRALKLQPNRGKTWRNRGITFHELGRYEEAIASYDRALKLQPNRGKTWRNRGITFHELGRYEEAIASYDLAIQINPNYKKARHNRKTILGNLVGDWQNKGLADFKQDNYPDALTSWQRTFNIIQQEKLGNASDLIQEFLDEQLLPKFQQPAVRNILPQILTIYTTAQVLPELGVALTRNLKAIQSPSISDYTATEWLNMWQELGKPHPELALALRMLEAGIKYKQNPTDDRVFLSLPQEMRPLFREALGLEP